MNAPGMIEVPLLAAEPDGRRHEVARLVYVLEEESRVAELEAENDKLRSLVRDVWTAYSTKADESFHPAWEVDVALLDRIRELGIEVE